MNVLSKVPAFSSVSCSQSSSLSNASPQSVGSRSAALWDSFKIGRGGQGVPGGEQVVQKQPSQQRFEACGLL